VTPARSLALLLLAAAPAAHAAEADAFAGKVKPISGQLYQKAGRLELTPALGLSLNDAFFQKAMFGAKATWHFRDWLSVGGSFATGLASETDSTQVCPAGQGCRPATAAQLARVPGEVKMMAGGEVGFSPVYAKLNFLAEKVIHFDLSILAGADWISYREVLPGPVGNPASAVSPGTASAFGGHVGLGSRVFLAEWGALRLEVKDHAYRVPVGGKDKWEQQLLLELGLSVFLPLGNRAP